MKQTILIVIAWCTAMVLCLSQRCSSSAIPMGYELYSWQEQDDSWSFSILPSPSGVNLSAQEVFDRKFRLSGVKELKRQISGLPVGATIFWLNHLSSTGQTEKE